MQSDFPENVYRSLSKTRRLQGGKTLFYSAWTVLDLQSRGNKLGSSLW